MSDWGKVLLGGLALGGLAAALRRAVARAAAPPPAFRDDTVVLPSTHVRIVGDGPRVAWYFHGFGMSIDRLGPLLHALAVPGWTIAAPQLGPKSEPPAGLALDLRGAAPAPAALLAHSGGYRALASALRTGLVHPTAVALFDALYGELDAYAAYIEAGGRFVDVAGPTTRANAEALKARIHSTIVYGETKMDVATLADRDSRTVPVLFATTTVAHDAVPAAFGPPILRGWT